MSGLEQALTTVRAAYKFGRTTRLTLQARDDAGAPINLTDRTLEVKLAPGELSTNVVTATSGVLSATAGTLFWEVTQANLTTLGNVNNVWTVVNIYNGDNTLAYEAFGVIEVRL